MKKQVLLSLLGTAFMALAFAPAAWGQSINAASVTNLDYLEGQGPSDDQTFLIDATGLDPQSGSITIDAPVNFEISETGNNSTYGSSLSFGYNGGEVSDKKIHVQLKAGLAVGDYSGDATITGGGANTTIDFQGSVFEGGLQIGSSGVPYLINFEQTVANVNFGEFMGQGFRPGAQQGQLDSNSWQVVGMSEGDLYFGGTKTTGDYAMGTASGAVSDGGIYSFLTGPAMDNNTLGIQPTATDFTGGAITLRIQNETGAILTSLQLGYTVFIYNDGDYSSSFNFGYSSDNINFTNVANANISTVQAAAPSPTWDPINRNFQINSISIAPGDYFYLRWTSDDISGSGNRDQFGLDDISVMGNPTAITYIYNDNDADPNNNWTPSDPNGTPGTEDDLTNPEDNLIVQNGMAVLKEDIDFNNITISASTTLKVEKVLTFNGNLNNNGHLIFANGLDALGQLAEVAPTSSFDGSGMVTMQRFIPQNRAFRFISPAISTNTTINFNWQEDAQLQQGEDIADANPHPGFGTHITGSETAQNGFDATPTGNPSLFLYDNIAQDWGPIDNTNMNTLHAGMAYRLFVRGDRSINVRTNNAPATNTTLEAAGPNSGVVIGSYENTNLSPVGGDFNFVGNPYRSIVDINQVLASSTNVYDGYYYVFDPDLNVQGSYVVVELPNGTNSKGSSANEYVQVAQAFFVRTGLGTATPVLKFEEAFKTPFIVPTDVFRPAPNDDSFINLQLYAAQAFDNGGSVADGLRVYFSEDGDNAVLLNDAAKMLNIDENVALRNGASYLGLEKRAMPTDGEEISLFNNNYQYANYTYKIKVNNLADNVTAYLRDGYLDNRTELQSGVNIIDFSVDKSVPASISDDRFSFVFNVNGLSIGDNKLSDFTVYPNPVTNGNFFVALSGPTNEKVQVALYDLLGRQVYTAEKEVGSDHRIQIQTSGLNAGIYMVKITDHGKTATEKLIIQ